MGRLVNTFSWSFSAAADFDECRRRRYWSKYGMWGGWDSRASEECRLAYRLSKMDNRWSLMGRAAEEAVMWMLRREQEGVVLDAEAAYEQIARPLLLRAWGESRDRLWLKNPKKFCNLREHYYHEFSDRAAENAAVLQVRDQVRLCLQHFAGKTLPRLKGVARADEVPVAAGGGGDVEHFLLEGVKIYAIPDYVYREGERFHIIDWKAGCEKKAHLDQVSLYGLWAYIRHHVPLENITLYIEYLKEGRVAVAGMDAGRLERVKERIGGSVGEMTEYLEDADRARNEPLPKEEWELAADPESCRTCAFYELCRTELERDSMR